MTNQLQTGSAHAGQGAPLTVLQSFSQPRTTSNPYISELLSSLPPELVVHTFTWKRALLGHYHVLHIHWPERLLRRSSVVRSLVSQLLFSLLLLRCLLRGTAIVRTIHNAEPHETGSMMESPLLTLCDHITTWRISLNGVDLDDNLTNATTIPHGHYRDWYRNFRVPPRVDGRLSFVGLVRDYKNVPGLLDAFRDLPRPEATLTIAGEPASEALRNTVSSATRADPRVTAILRHVDEAEMADIIGQSQLVVLPYKQLGNSGAALLALSLGRPVLLPLNDATRALASELGEQWVRLYENPLEAADLNEALTATAELRSGDRPDLSRRDWNAIGRMHADVYRDARLKRRRLADRGHSRP